MVLLEKVLAEIVTQNLDKKHLDKKMLLKSKIGKIVILEMKKSIFPKMINGNLIKVSIFILVIKV